ncbi:hypothetical protein BRADI_2g09261v3 [Brachypodium distachyon]|uniref:4-hydroxy-7-methoxy-3-oxo-3,4-dihydro-2H-1,4-benzoxazin-2-yl glucosidebeta-D-glucosidase n=1 Tax=Brachypodium distachyon TaxID=15368 RepID=A0A2K2D7N0_BRADI|nr:hypothetical protein BRADI_2g09261v3 [Brachypodium distachyon]
MRPAVVPYTLPMLPCSVHGSGGDELCHIADGELLQVEHELLARLSGQHILRFGVHLHQQLEGDPVRSHGDDPVDGDVAADGYPKYKEDIKLMTETGLAAYRFSISWSRLIPYGRREVNPKGLEYYNDLINELLDHGIQPHVTILQYDLPQILEDEYDGWLSPQIMFLDPLYYGDFNSVDFLGVNYYKIMYVKDDPQDAPSNKRDIMADISGKEIFKTNSTTGFHELDYGLEEVLEYLKHSYGNRPIYIHENGKYCAIIFIYFRKRLSPSFMESKYVCWVYQLQG